MKMLSKSRYMAGLQCSLKLWYDCNRRDLASEVTESQQAIFDTGHEVGRLAQDRYPGGVLIEADYRHTDNAIEQTDALLEDPQVPSIFEAPFVYDDVVIRADILERIGEDAWRLIEVKSTTRLKQVHEPDVAVQYQVLRGAGINVVEVGVLTLNTKYIFDGENLDLDQLFQFHDVTL